MEFLNYVLFLNDDLPEPGSGALIGVFLLVFGVVCFAHLFSRLRKGD